MSCLCRSSLCKLIPYWVRGLFQCDSDYSHTSSHMNTSLPAGEARLETPYPDPSCTASTITLSSASTICLPTPPPCVSAPGSALQCHTGYQRTEPIPFSYNETPVLDPATKLGGRDFRWSDFFLKNSKWLMQQYLCFLLTVNK